jgi:L-lactate dehydrogenase complex protein LldG
VVAVAVSAKEEMLGRIRDALADAPAPPPVPRTYRRSAHYDDLTGLFAERVSDYRANVRRSGDAEAAVREALADHGARRVLMPGDDHGLSAHELDEIDGVVTGCEVAIAETGTIVLSAAQGRRAITLVPDLHVCVVEESRIVATVPEALERLSPASGPLTFVAGPSATSDIELSRVEGVHGPRRLEVVISPSF